MGCYNTLTEEHLQETYYDETKYENEVNKWDSDDDTNGGFRRWAWDKYENSPPSIWMDGKNIQFLERYSQWHESRLS